MSNPEDFIVFVYEYNADNNVLCTTIKLIDWEPADYVYEVYDPYTTRWFLITSTLEQDYGMDNRLYSGCLRNYFGTSCTVDMTEEKYEIDTLDIHVGVNSIDAKRIGNKHFLAVLKSTYAYYTIELFSYDESEVSRFKDLRIIDRLKKYVIWLLSIS